MGLTCEAMPVNANYKDACVIVLKGSMVNPGRLSTHVYMLQ